MSNAPPGIAGINLKKHIVLSCHTVITAAVNVPFPSPASTAEEHSALSAGCRPNTSARVLLRGRKNPLLVLGYRMEGAGLPQQQEVDTVQDPGASKQPDRVKEFPG
jgi:hypothetical protein